MPSDAVRCRLFACNGQVRQLFLLGALDADGGLTVDGRAMSRLPLDPSLSRTLLSAAMGGCAAEGATICAMATGEDPYCRAGRAELVSAAEATRAELASPEGDHISLWHLYEAWTAVMPSQRRAWCDARGVRGAVLRQAHEVRSQLLQLLRELGVTVPGAFTSGTARADDTRTAVARVSACCRRALADGYYFHSARRMRGTAVFQTLAPPPQTLCLTAAAAATAPPSSNALAQAEYVVYGGLAWQGRAVMLRVSLVEWQWLAAHLPKLHDVDEDRLLGLAKRPTGKEGGGAADHTPAGASTTHGTLADAPGRMQESTTRRNGESAVSAARQRYLERKRSRT